MTTLCWQMQPDCHHHDLNSHRSSFDLFPPMSSAISSSLLSLPTGMKQKDRDGDGGHNADGQPRRRVAMACQRCRKRKIKCSGEGDPRGCASCLQAPEEGLKCTFWRMGTSHELLLSHVDEHEDSPRQSTAIHSPTSDWPGNGYQYGVAVTVDHLQQTTHLDCSKGDTDPMAYLSPTQSNSGKAQLSPNGVQSPGANAFHPYARRQSSISRGAGSSAGPFGYESSGFENTGTTSNTSYGILTGNVTGQSWTHGQVPAHGLPSVRETPDSMDIDGFRPMYGQSRQLPLPETIRSNMSTFSQPDFNPGGIVSYHADTVRTSPRDALLLNNMPGRPMPFNTSGVASAYPGPFPASVGCMFENTTAESTACPNSASINTTFAPTRYMNPENHYAPNPATQTPNMFEAGLLRRKSYFQSYSFNPDPSPDSGYASQVGTDYGNTLVSGHRYDPLPPEPNASTIGPHELDNGSTMQNRAAYRSRLTARGHRGGM